MKAILNKEAVIKASKEVPPLFGPEATLEIAERIIQAYFSVLYDDGYSQYPDIATYINEPIEKKEIRAAIRSKKQVIQMFTREILELEALL